MNASDFWGIAGTFTVSRLYVQVEGRFLEGRCGIPTRYVIQHVCRPDRCSSDSAYRRRPPARDRRVVLSLRGIVVFSGLYALALTGVGMFGAVTPIGGLLFLVGCAGLAVFALGR